MRPSSSVILEPGLERGSPWGRDLFTFVSSAAGHMMRTLQKPRKNRPSKRQVNHRRFLHNMIQRKFADIEASNHRLASALFSTEEEKITSSEPTKSVTPETSDCPPTDVQSDPAGVSNALRDTDSKSVTGHTLDSHQSQVIKKKWPDSRNMWKHGNPKSPQKTNTISGSHQGKGSYRQPCQDWGGNENPVEFITLSSPNHTDLYTAVEHFQRENYSVENPLNVPSTINLSEGSLFTWTENVKETNVNNNHLNQSLGTYPSFSPEVSQLSLDSCDFSIKFLTDISVCTQAKKNIVDIVESQWMDMMELLQPDRDVGDCIEVEPSFENICNADRMGGTTCPDDVTIVDQSESFMEYMPWSNSCCRGEVEHMTCVGRSYTLGDACGCQQDQGSTTDLFISDQRTSQYALMSDSEEADLTSHKPSQGLDITPSQLSNYTSFHYDVPKHDMYSYTQQESLHMLLNCESNGCTPFDGVAQSFSAPIQKSQHYPIITPPLEDEWFVDILEESQSPEC